MRPVEKKKPGDIVEYTTSMNETVTHTIKVEYKPYRSAKDALSANIGSFCSYCEELRKLADLHVDHIEPKSKEGALYDWENFLLACNICNSCKKDADVDIENTHFPHRDNTYLDFIYDESGRVKVNPDLPKEEYQKAERLYNLVKMGRDPWGEEATSLRDNRWSSRFETWNKAKRSLELYQAGNIEICDIMNSASSCGNWSIWFTVFKGYDEVRKALIEQTPGTCATCFDAENHYEPIARKA